MQNYINTIKISGTIVKEIQLMEGKESCLKFTVITKEQVTAPSGQKFEEAIFHNVVIFGEKAKAYKLHLKKGDWIDLEGKLSQRKYNNRYYTQIIASRIATKSPDFTEKQAAV